MIKALIVTPHRDVYNRFINVNDANREEYPWVSSSAQILGYHKCFAFMLYGSGNTFDHAAYSYMFQHEIEPLYF
jgi:hypothetical protein